MREPESSPPAPREPGVLGRAALHGAAMVGVALVVLHAVDRDHADTDARLSALEDELSLARYERDRMAAMNGELVRELDKAVLEGEIVRWQLAYTQVRLESERTGQAVVAHAPPPPTEIVSLDPVSGRSPDAPPELSAASPVSAAAQVAVTGGLPQVAGPAPLDATRVLSLDEPELAVVLDTAPVSQLSRDRAFSVWSGIVSEAVTGECGTGPGAGARRCRDRVRRTLFPLGTRAVECMLSGNAAADYVSGVPLHALPTHSVPLDAGAVILCDNGLRNL